MRISQRRAATSFYGYDAGGSVRQLFDNTGTITDTYAYDAFGNTVAQTGSTVNEFQYRGEQYDASLQMYYLRARWYRPLVGRFLTRDTYEGRPSDPSSLHQYAYTNADPVNGADPRGHANLITWAARVGIISELAAGAKQAGLDARGLASLEEAVFLLEQRGAIIQEGIEWFEPQPGRVTAAVSQLLDPKTGRVIQAVALNGKHLTGRFIDAIIAPFEVPIVGFFGHAEEQVIAFAQKMNYQIISIAATRPICAACAGQIVAQEVRQGFQIFVSAVK
jgi:RHS repeat-associated protein